MLERKVEQLMNLIKMAGLRQVQQGLNEVQRRPAHRVDDQHTHECVPVRVPPPTPTTPKVHVRSQTHQVRMFLVSSSGRERCIPMVTWRQGKSAKLNSGHPDKA